MSSNVIHTCIAGNMQDSIQQFEVRRSGRQICPTTTSQMTKTHKHNSKTFPGHFKGNKAQPKSS